MRDSLLFDRRRYSEFLAGVDGISTNILAQRLKRLQERGFLDKFSDPGDGKSYIYLPTEEGLALWPVLVAILRWGMESDRLSAVPPFMQALAGEHGAQLRERRCREVLEQRARLG